MIFGSVCSGIEAASVAWEPLGWRCAFMSEIEPFPRAVLAHRFPHTRLHGDFTTIEDQYEAIDLLVGGTPCQSFSVAGLRGGMDDARGNLALEYLRLADRLRPRWLVWENVPGVLSSNGGRDFGSILGGMGELGYGVAYRVLDAQHFGVPQRRRRVFVVGYFGDWRRAAAVLFERHSLSGNTPPRRETGEIVAALTANGVGTCGADDNQGQAGLISHCLNAGGMRRQDYETETLIAHALRGEGFDASEDGTGRGMPLVFDTTQITSAGVPPAVAFDLRGREGGAQIEGPHGTANIRAASGGSSRSYVAFAQNQRNEVRAMDVAGALAAKRGTKQQTYIADSAVRRLTPRECERLQGFPDDFSLVPYRNKPAADGPRYKAIGNSMAVPVMRWIGERIAAVERGVAVHLSPAQAAAYPGPRRRGPRRGDDAE